MAVEIAHWYDAVEKELLYNHKQQVSIPSLGSYDGLRVPDALLTALYYLDPKTGELKQNVKLIFQTDGRSNAQLNFMHQALIEPYRFHLYTFDVNTDIVFGEGSTLSRTGKAGINIELGKEPLKGGGELGKQYPDTKTTLHARISGKLNAKASRLEASGERVGVSGANRNR